MDGKFLKRVFSNIIINVVNYINDIGNVYIKVEKENDYIKVLIKDDGEGIDEVDLFYIFNRFYSKSVKKGIGGLGLLIVKEII